MKKDKKVTLKLASLLLEFSWYMGWGLLGLYLVTSVAVPMMTGESTLVNVLPVHFEVPAPAADPNVTIETGDSPKSIFIPQADGIISFSTNDIKLHLLAALEVILDSLAFLFILFQLKKIVSRVREGKPFVSENLDRIRKINYAVFGYAVLSGLYKFISSSIVQSDFYTQLYLPNVNIQPDWEIFNSNLILLILIILVIEQSFRIGLKLQEDKDLTI